MLVLGIDQSYNSSGVVILDDTKLIHIECYKSDKSKNRYGQAHEIALHVGEIYDRFRPDVVVLEGLAFGIRGNVTRDLGGLQYAIIMQIQEIKKHPVEIIAPLSIKKFATGNGRAKKNEMIEALPEYIATAFLDTGVKKTTGLSDLSDAYWLCRYVQNKME